MTHKKTRDSLLAKIRDGKPTPTIEPWTMPDNHPAPTLGMNPVPTTSEALSQNSEGIALGGHGLTEQGLRGEGLSAEELHHEDTQQYTNQPVGLQALDIPEGEYQDEPSGDEQWCDPIEEPPNEHF